MTLASFLQVLLGGVLIGGLYALVAFGLSLVYGVVRVLNFAHGTLLAIGGVIASIAYAAWGVHPLVTMLAMIPIYLAFGYGAFVVLLQPLSKRGAHESTIGTVLVTVGMLLILSDVTAQLAGSTQRNIRIQSEVMEVGEVIIPLTQAWILAGVAALTVGMHFLLTRTWFGRAIRATTQDQVAAQLCGVRSQHLRAMTFAFGCAIVGVTSVLYAMSFPVDPYIGFGLTVKAFTIIVLGGIGNLPGALLAGIFLGVAEGMTGFLWRPEWAPAVSAILLLAILVLFPHGMRRAQ